MDLARPGNPTNLLSLNEAAQYIAVSPDVLIALNEHDILKPTINTNGEIAYTKSQLDKFKGIQNSTGIISRETSHINNEDLQHIKNVNFPPQKENFINKHANQLNNYSQINNYHFHNNTSIPGKEIKASISLKKLTLSLSFLGIALLILTISQQTKFNPLLYQNTTDKGVGYDSHNAVIETTNQSNNDNTINNEKDKITKNTNSLNDAFESKNNNNPSNLERDRDNLKILQSILGSDIDESGIEVETENEIVTYGQKANLRSSSTRPEYAEKSDAVNGVFDTEGNIKVSRNDPSEKELLATALGASGLSQGQDLVKQSSSTAGLLTFLILGLLFIYFLYSSRKQLIPSSGSYSELGLQPINFNAQNELEWEKILEVNQKTDGTVVIIFHGKEYKVCKPELDSESDKFIERLMQLTNSGEKEIEYDALSDQSINLGSPLSKLVTRLGFVGIKRDLFFPRTSKSRVLFRKYLTLDDLFSMNLTIEDLSEKIDKIN